ncbi:MAG: error-prone DNA polymerase, partial [Bythopirellula sp.]
AVLDRTLGVPIFQEQAMKLAEVAAGFTPGEADQLRRAMAAWRSPGKIEHYRQKLVEGMLARGLDQEFAERCYRQLQGFGEYGFPESHAASFALLVYASCWLKYHQPAAFCAAMLNSQPLGFYAPAQLVRDTRQHGVDVLPVDINHSDWDCTLELAADKLALRLGMRLVRGLRSEAAQRIEQARQTGKFQSLDDLRRRARLNRPTLSTLADADVFGSLNTNRRQALWYALGQEKSNADRPLFSDLDEQQPMIDTLPLAAPEIEVFEDYQALGLSLKNHPLAFHREDLNQRGVLAAEALQDLETGRQVAVAGIVLLRQRPGTAKGITFVTLEDETGVTNLIIHARTWERYYRVAKHNRAWIAQGELQHAEGVIHLLVRHLEPLQQEQDSTSLETLQVPSRDFR